MYKNKVIDIITQTLRFNCEIQHCVKNSSAARHIRTYILLFINSNELLEKPNFSDQFKKIVKRFIRVGYNLDVMRQSACLVLNPIMVYSYGFLFNNTTLGQTSDSMMALT